MAQCPQCRGDLIDDDENSVWNIGFSTLTTTASGLDTGSFSIEVVLDSETSVTEDLAAQSGTVDGDRTEFYWSITSPGTPVSGTIEVTHDTLGNLEQTLTVSSA